jgi:hypothetical protein
MRQWKIRFYHPVGKSLRWFTLIGCDWAFWKSGMVYISVTLLGFGIGLEHPRKEPRP